MSDTLPIAITRSLSDKLYEKRKLAALEVEKLVRESVQTGSALVFIPQLLNTLNLDFVQSPVPNARNGGLIALAAVAIALGSENLTPHLEGIVNPILGIIFIIEACFLDHDPRVRYYACESMYNLAKVSRTYILTYFNEIFDALAKLSVDVELVIH